ncbi:MAG: hypothetical protein IJI40_04750 [Firmicutes bacterium]|nr:hypothetical protein [Bacillota bacterium]MBQ6606071.1 hypothetical protein [Bacillota bacterium]
MPEKERDMICGCGACVGDNSRCRCAGCCCGVPEFSECAGTELSPVEAGLLRDLAQLAFLPLAFTADMQPVYYDHSLAPPELTEAVASLLRKGLITADPLPLLNYAYDEYEGFPQRGSMALTAAGQAAAELLDSQGAAE